MQWKFTPGMIILAFVFFAVSPAKSQLPADTVTTTTSTDTVPPTSIDPQLLELSNSRNPKEYTLGKIKIAGTKYLDEQLLISISGLTTGDKVTMMISVRQFPTCGDKICFPIFKYSLLQLMTELLT